MFVLNIEKSLDQRIISGEKNITYIATFVSQDEFQNFHVPNDAILDVWNNQQRIDVSVSITHTNIRVLC